MPLLRGGRRCPVGEISWQKVAINGQIEGRLQAFDHKRVREVANFFLVENRATGAKKPAWDDRNMTFLGDWVLQMS